MAVKKFRFFLSGLVRAPVYAGAVVFAFCFYSGSLACLLIGLLSCFICSMSAIGIFCLVPRGKRPALIIFFSALLGVYASIQYIKTAAPLFTLISENEISQLSGYVCGNPSKTAGGLYRVPFAVSAAGGSFFTSSARGKVQLLLPASAVESLYPGKLYSAAVHKMDVSSRKTAEAALIEKGIFLSVKVKPSGGGRFFSVQSINAAEWGQLSGLWFFRARLRLELKRLLYSWGEAGGLLLALLSGSREYIAPEVAAAFRNAGLSHVLALSGMHLSLFGSLALIFGRFAGGRRTGEVCALVFMALFVFFAGDSPSLTRSLICAVLLAAGRFCSLPVSVLGALAASFILQAVLFPADAFELSFLLSYGALAGILTLGQFFERFLRPYAPPAVLSPVCASAAACFCTAPISIGAFSMFAPVGIISSAVVSPFATVFLAAGFICVLCSLAVPALTVPLGVLIKIVYSCVRMPVLWFARVPPVTFP